MVVAKGNIELNCILDETITALIGEVKPLRSLYNHEIGHGVSKTKTLLPIGNINTL
jgi:hypothetical protein